MPKHPKKLVSNDFIYCNTDSSNTVNFTTNDHKEINAKLPRDEPSLESDDRRNEG